MYMKLTTAVIVPIRATTIMSRFGITDLQTLLSYSNRLILGLAPTPEVKPASAALIGFTSIFISAFPLTLPLLFRLNGITSRSRDLSASTTLTAELSYNAKRSTGRIPEWMIKHPSWAGFLQDLLQEYSMNESLDMWEAFEATKLILALRHI